MAQRGGDDKLWRCDLRRQAHELCSLEAARRLIETLRVEEHELLQSSTLRLPFDGRHRGEDQNSALRASGIQGCGAVAAP